MKFVCQECYWTESFDEDVEIGQFSKRECPICGWDALKRIE